MLAAYSAAFEVVSLYDVPVIRTWMPITALRVRGDVDDDHREQHGVKRVVQQRLVSGREDQVGAQRVRRELRGRMVERARSRPSRRRKTATAASAPTTMHSIRVK